MGGWFYSLAATGEGLTEFSIPPVFTRASIPADPDGKEIESEHEVASRSKSIGNHFTPSPGVEGSSERVRAKAHRNERQTSADASPTYLRDFNVKN